MKHNNIVITKVKTITTTTTLNVQQNVKDTRKNKTKKNDNIEKKE